MKKRNGNVELLRFLFAWIIVLFHGGLHFKGGYLAVEFFFTITGFFLAEKIYLQNDGTISIERSIIDATNYILYRYKAIFPYLFISSIIGAIVQAIGKSWSVKGLILRMPYIIGDLLCVQNFGIPVMSATGVVWYLGAMFFAIWLIYPLLKIQYKLISYIAPVATGFISGLIVHTCGNLNAQNTTILGWINTGFLRAILGILLGITVFNLVQLIKIKLTSDMCWPITLIEIICYTLYGTYMFVWNEGFGNGDILAVISMACALTCTMSKHSKLYGLFNNNVVYFFGNWSVPIFLNHFQWMIYMNTILQKLEVKCSAIIAKTIALIMVIVTSLFVYYTVKWLKRKLAKKYF